MMRQWVLLGIGVIAGALMIVGCKTTRAGYESLDYKVLRQDGKSEVRKYPAFTVVYTSMENTEAGGDAGFERLFKFIQGRNQRQEKIAMTTPVLFSTNNNAFRMSFVLPKDVAAKGAPLPTGTNVALQAIETGHFAALRFSGSRSGEASEKARVRLLEWIAKEKLDPSSPTLFAYYDPPWIPSFLRRNEVLIRVKD